MGESPGRESRGSISKHDVERRGRPQRRGGAGRGTVNGFSGGVLQTTTAHGLLQKDYESHRKNIVFVQEIVQETVQETAQEIVQEIVQKIKVAIDTLC